MIQYVMADSIYSWTPPVGRNFGVERYHRRLKLLISRWVYERLYFICEILYFKYTTS